ncbi:MHYT domain-containing protein [Donghicola eburneus]|uniref:MHYT domain-containing protein n=1 Tax=Donghicola eburneus TaxID=393278 RepID=UPI0008EAF6C2|nr:MHYT domain-containing protein [Donghicola eburneus]SFQ66999.1 MHYT domain-containing protein, NO-binding membrane sensor [Donghicola eburneus]
MTFIDYGHNLWLVAISFVVALVAGATGLWLTKDLSKKTVLQRKLSVALAAIALGGGIWSMHFVAMLGLRMPMLFYYDAAITLVSALIAILIVTSALLLLHFRKRTKTTILIAGTLVGAGVLAMHYVGMAGMQLCQPVYTPSGVIGSSILAIGLCILAFAVAYGRRSNRNILIGTLCFGVAVTAVHFLAMSSTNFVALERTQEIGPLISKEVMAIGVILSSFVIFGMFLWVGSTVLVPVDPNSADPVATAPVDQPTETTPASPEIWVPCEREGAKVRVAAGEVAFVRADGHYTQIYTEDGRYYCAWPITEATKRLVPEGLMKVHRSYLVNPSKVVHFERKKDKGRCSFGPSGLPEVPVSRSHLKEAETAFS